MANPNPSPETRFTSSGNPAGKTAAQRKAEVQAAEISAQMRLRALIRMQEKLDAGEMDATEVITSDTLRLFKDSEDRAHGTPKATVEGPGENGEHLHKVSSDAAFATFVRIVGGHATASAGDDPEAGGVGSEGAT
jgi:hypothetical protein